MTSTTRSTAALKAVRTRYRNTLERELDNIKLITHNYETLGDADVCIKTSYQSIALIKTYCSKLSDQMDKILDTIGDTDETFMETVVNDDCALIFTCEQTVIEMTQYVENIKSEKEVRDKETASVSENDERMLALQESMHKLMLTQVNQQKVFFDSKSKEEKVNNSVKLPKLELSSFNGDKLQWTTFWDAFECTVHSNKRISDVEKYNYLVSKLTGEARRAVAGLAITADNYAVAIGILRDRFGEKQAIIDLHYKELMNMPTASNSVESVKFLLDRVEKHIRSLEVLGENVNQQVFVSMIRSKLPEDVLYQLELMKGPKNEWSVQKLRDSMQQYVSACEHSQLKQKGNYKEQTKNHSEVRFQKPVKFHVNEKQPKGSAETLFADSQMPRKSVVKRDHCRYCEKKHWSDECPTYKTVDQRKKKIKNSCYRCLRDNHTKKECKLNKTCVYCGEQNEHHRSLCPKKFKNKEKCESAKIAEEVNQPERTVPEENAMISSGEMVLMQTAKTFIGNEQSHKLEETRLLLDCGSQRSYITQKLADKLGLKQEKEEEIKLITFGKKHSTSIKTKSTSLFVQLVDGTKMQIRANIVPVISGNVQRRPVDVDSNPTLKNLVQSVTLADSIPSEHETSSIELLIGNDYYLDLVLPQKIEVQPGLYLLGSKLGWLLTGRTSETYRHVDESSLLILTYGTAMTTSEVFQSVDRCVSQKPVLEDFWNVEAIGVTDKQESCDDTKAMDNFKETLQFHDGRYHVTWPWKEDVSDLPDNRMLALGRLRSCVKRLRNNPELFKKYDTILQDQLKAGVIEKVCSTDGMIHYIPHHAVIKPQNTTTKLRVVYDASAKARNNQRSLNECLQRGPVMLHDLCGILMRFRLREIAVVADIEKAFLQIGLQQQERDVTRFLWLKDIEDSAVDMSNVEEYRFCRVPFGIISSPFLLGATVEAHLDLCASELANKLKNDIYVDNVVTGTATIGEAIHLYQESKKIFKDASMNLREWRSNSETVNDSVLSEDRASETTMKLLGHTWDSVSDTLKIRKSSDAIVSDKPTKRQMLSVIASVFDPMGLVAPVVLRGKILLQDLWKQKYDWDDPIEDVCILEKWNNILTDLEQVTKASIRRCVFNSVPINREYRLLCFCDASGSAYAAAVYLHTLCDDGKSTTNLLFAKTRLAPVKEMTIPRLELMAVLIGVRCLSFVNAQLYLPIEGQYLWTDSKCVLDWLKTSKTLPVFVRNRVKEIQQHSEITKGYVKTKENPADLATRGSTMDDLAANNLWWCGPEWLQISPPQDWMSSHEPETEKRDNKISEIECENNASFKVCEKITCPKEQQCSPFGISENNFSSVTKLLRVTAYAARFVKRLQKKSCDSGVLTSDELKSAETMWISYIQRKNYQDVLNGLEKGKPTNIQRQLGLYLDENRLLRCKGRLENSSLSEGTRRPILLPQKERYTTLIVEQVHKSHLHVGVSQTLALTRERFWIPQGRSLVRSVLKKCTVCRKYEGGPYKMPEMPPLPKERVSESHPFDRIGLDYLGPMQIKTSEGVRKVWICLFTCMVTRSVHLELVLDMTSEEFILAFKRFVSQRGTPSEIFSDNAAQFKAANRVLECVWNNVVLGKDVQTYVSTNGIKWKFNVQLAPWMGGFYERLVGVVKRSLRKTIGRKLLTLIQLQTVLKEVESVVNSRPLIYVGDDVNSRITLTPSHFLSLNPKIGIPDTEDDEGDYNYSTTENLSDKLINMWKKGTTLLNTFWKIWREEYILSLRERTQTALKGKRVSAPFQAQVGDVVLIKEDLPRGCWKMGRITDLIHSRDGNIRAASLETSNGRQLNRPLNLLYPIECSMKETSPSHSETRKTEVQVEYREPSRRSAAIEARQKIKEQIM